MLEGARPAGVSGRQWGLPLRFVMPSHPLPPQADIWIRAGVWVVVHPVSTLIVRPWQLKCLWQPSQPQSAFIHYPWPWCCAPGFCPLWCLMPNRGKVDIYSAHMLQRPVPSSGPRSEIAKHLLYINLIFDIFRVLLTYIVNLQNVVTICWLTQSSCC